MKKGKLNIVYGGQCGSEAKGKQSAYLVDKFNIRHVGCCLSPNAGHTWVGENGKKAVTHHLPVGMYGARERDKVRVYVGAAAVINPTIFLKEVEEAVEAGFNRRFIYLDARAAIITAHHISKERKLAVIGSTGQGVGEARSDRIMRKATLVHDIPELRPYMMRDVGAVVRDVLKDGDTVLYEMGQGFDLCLQHGIHPTYCTSRINSPQAGLADIGVPARDLGDTYAVIRTFPIRVNNREGSSGPYPSAELTWEDIRRVCGAPHDLTEMTTTTKLPRRVFEFSVPQIQRMIRICDPTYLCVQFANYVDWECYQSTEIRSSEVREWVNWVERSVHRKVAYVGTGPKHNEMVDMGVDRNE